MLSYVTDHIPKTTPYNRRPGYSMTPDYITIHSTGNPTSTARNERAWLTNPNNNVTASWHIVVDEKEAIEAIPLNEVAWHAGDGGNGTGNRKSIGIEICESGDRQKTLQNAAELVAKLLKERGWGVDRLRRHYDWSGKICPRIFYDNGKWTGWEQF
ncbi:N-acetylmuramoyl-L-alanine amidase [Thermoclostridium stercorarium]|uniref:peptidoglycan recognition protein family protein n=1 Tax=Thermoclostridium stercorarium TaxID=1510 RepID=UPI0022498BF6|nr:N-acetylmuramoyl-L-alanine amidase [Thermoclostridium stercorarium]UZQ86322.1 N-acetylmuramoyl-L-alanine amidase [Thermoclostridium stercorarium]